MALTWDNISAITSKKWVPKLVDNIFDSNPFFQRCRSKNMLKLDGGTSIMRPLEYAANSNNGWYSGADTMLVNSSEEITAAEYQWRQAYVSIMITGTEELKNAGDSAKLKLVQAKTKNAQRTMEDILGTALFNAGTAAKALHGLRHVVDQGNTVGGIDQATNSWWQAQEDSTSTVTTMSALQVLFNNCSIGNDSPTLGLTTRSIYNYYYNLLQPAQRFQDKDTARGGFTSLMFNAVPIIVDSHCPASHLFFLNEKYIDLTVHKDFNFKNEPFAKPINQDVRVSKILFAGQFCSTNNRMHGKFTALAA